MQSRACDRPRPHYPHGWVDVWSELYWCTGPGWPRRPYRLQARARVNRAYFMTTAGLVHRAQRGWAHRINWLLAGDDVTAPGQRHIGFLYVAPMCGDRVTALLRADRLLDKGDFKRSELCEPCEEAHHATKTERRN